MTDVDPRRFDLTVEQAIAQQQALRSRVVLAPPPGFAPRLVAGLDVSMERFGDVGYAGIVVLEQPGLRTVDEASAVAPLRFPYVPGLLSFRELPLIVDVWDRLRTRPDVLIFDGQGIAHPRRFGIACHGGVLFGVPSIGCAKSILVGRHGTLGAERGSRAPLEHRGEIVGMAVRLRDRVNPVYVSPGHLVDLETAVDVVLAASAGYREPETTRRAHRLVNEERRKAKS
ncbi:Endonuclease V [Gemmatirosa kalamazoonensis]|uniref:Endonuclease V n=1 Tax=Gemmatirosa kalamazoonensis TaxID=861299 RepID=W0RNG2_9BACT|nr:deoxyribonuclease V [Gemmatirosa kalamazoonensis]AHG92037.1 Endonuclease V [Gemmatirosa kalamazoonensis]